MEILNTISTWFMFLGAFGVTFLGIGLSMQIGLSIIKKLLF